MNIAETVQMDAKLGSGMVPVTLHAVNIVQQPLVNNMAERAHLVKQAFMV
jgi:hypothetical protein